MGGNGGSWRRAFGLICGMAAGLALAAPASGYIRGPHLVAAGIGGTTDASYSLGVPAPAPVNPSPNTDYPLGGGAGIFNGDGRQAVSSALVVDPAYSPPWATGGISLNPGAFWSIEGFAYYAESSAAEPATVAAGADYVKQVKLVTRTSEINSKDKQLAAACPDGKNVISGGARIVDGGSKVAFESLGTENTEKFGIVAREVNPTTRVWGVVVYAFCANYTTPATGNVYAGSITIKLKTSPSDSSDVKTMEAGCPFPYSVIGGGAGTLETSDKAALLESRPRDNKWVATARELAPDAGNWSLKVRVICSVLGQSGP
jgi:hypothetical protein